MAQEANLDRYQPKLPPVAPAPAPQNEAAPAPAISSPDKSQELIGNLIGVVFVANAGEVKKEGRRDKGVKIENLPLLQKDKKFQQAVQEKLGQPLTFAGLDEITKLAVASFVQQGHPVVDAFAPEQFIEKGTLQIVVMEAKLGQVRAVGNKWFSESILLGGVRAKSGEFIDARQMGADADYLNGNPFRQVVPTFVRGSEPGTADIELRTQDRFPVRVYAGYEDNGSDLTGDERWMSGFNWGNAFGLDHQLNYQFTTSSNFWHFKAHSASYVIPIPALRHRLTILGSYGTSNADVPAPFALAGESWQAGLRYAVPFKGPEWLNHEATVGFDFKQSNNNLEFGGVEVFDTVSDVAQFVLGYSASANDKLGSTRMAANAYLSPGEWTDHNDEDSFLAARNDAQPDYAYLNITGERVTRLPWNFSWVSRGTVQVSDGNLLSSETLGVGGATSVRGYDEREVNGDQGWLASQELRTPAMSPLKWIGLGKVPDQLQLLGFWDYGVADIHRPMEGQNKDIELGSVGVGARYGISQYLSVKFDYGWQMLDSGANDRYNSRAHLSVMVSY